MRTIPQLVGPRRSERHKPKKQNIDAEDNKDRLELSWENIKAMKEATRELCVVCLEETAGLVGLVHVKEKM